MLQSQKIMLLEINPQINFSSKDEIIESLLNIIEIQKQNIENLEDIIYEL